MTYILGPNDYPQFEIRIDEVNTVPNRYTTRDELEIRATLHFPDSSETEVHVLLWAPAIARSVIQPETGFVLRRMVVEGFGDSDSENPYSRGSVAITAVWFEDPSNLMVGVLCAQVKGEEYSST